MSPFTERTPPSADFLTRQLEGPIPASHILTLVSETALTVCVRLFASYREAAGTNRLEVKLPAAARVSDLLELLAERLPALKRAPGMVAVNQTYVSTEAALQQGDEVALIPPVSGG